LRARSEAIVAPRIEEATCVFALHDTRREFLVEIAALELGLDVPTRTR
jgi:hypothetical protein